MNYSNDQGRQQFKQDDRVSLKTGKRIPDFIDLPDISFLTNFNFTPPCNGVQNCSDWFCTTFLRGPVARLEKIYNPQNTPDDLDNTTLGLYAGTNLTNLSNNSSRLLQTTTTSSDIAISETNSGIDFNTVASQTSLDSSITIDGVSTASDVYVDNTTVVISTNSTNSTNNSTNAGSFGNRGIYGAFLFVMTIIFSLI